LDKHYENKKNPDAQYELANVTDAQVEKVYEELFLRVNGIDPGVDLIINLAFTLGYYKLECFCTLNYFEYKYVTDLF
jgi:hypothetical protein